MTKFTNISQIASILLIPSLFSCSSDSARSALKPNILWLVSEDNSPYLGCYGDSLALTPNLDKLASDGIRYTRAYATSPVCSAARSTLITGMYGTRLGIYHHRSKHPIPEQFKPYPIYFREAGYYCTNNRKTDYNLVDDFDCWDESSGKAHYKNRMPGQPFFAIFNFGQSHESSVFPPAVLKKREDGVWGQESRVKPEEIKLPAYHPDLPEIRQEWADYYDAVTHMDRMVGERLQELKDLGLADSTIVIYYADHGGALARGKRSVLESGTRVPLIIFFPKMYRHFAPAIAGQSIDRLVSFVDFPATMLSLMDEEIPAQMDGLPFLGKSEKKPRDHVFIYRGRMDARYDFVRAIRDDRFRYVRNYTPYRPYGQPYVYAENSRITSAWRKAWQDGLCNVAQSVYWEMKPFEELYDVETDPDEVHNLIADLAYQNELEKLRDLCDEEMFSHRDVGFIPESMYKKLAGDSTLFDFAQSDQYQLVRIKQIADMAASGNPGHQSDLIEAMNDPDPIIRYWGAIGAVTLHEQALPSKDQLLTLLHDPFPEVRIAAAEALGYLGEAPSAVAQLAKELTYDESKDPYVYLYAGNALQYLDQTAVRAILPLLEVISNDSHYGETRRVTEYLVGESKKLY